MKNLSVPRTIFLTIFCIPLFLLQSAEAIFPCPEGLYLSAAYLRWKARQDQIYYASKLPQAVPAENIRPFEVPIEVIDQEFSFDSGFRVTAGYVFCGDWDARVRYTRFAQCSQGSASSNVLDPDGFVESAFNDITLNPLVFGRSASARWNLKFNVVDIDLGRFYDFGDCCEYVTFEPYIGITVADIKQRQYINGGVIPFGQDLAFTTAVATRCNSFVGAGPRMGADVSWNFADHFSLIGSASGALVIGKIKATMANFISDRVGAVPITCCTRQIPNFPNYFAEGWTFSVDDPTFTSKFCNTKTRLRPTVALIAGLEWDYEACNCWDVFISAAFEAQYWPDQWQCAISPSMAEIGFLPGGGDLSLYGATISFGVNF